MEFFNDVGNDPSRPSLFELVAQEQLRDLLQPALKYVLAVGILASLFGSTSLTTLVGIRTTLSPLSPSHSKQT